MTIKCLRVLAIVNVLTMMLQATFAGRMLGGDDLSANFHEFTAQMLVLIGVAQLVSMVSLRRRKGCSLGLVRASAGVLVAEILEFALGHFHHVAFHVPLGLAIFGGAIRQLLWVMWQRRAVPERVAT